MRNVIALAVVLYGALAGLAPAEARRVALVIGNSRYEHIAGLPNVPNDAKAMEAVFKAAKFDSVVVLQDRRVAELRRELLEFAERAAASDVAVVFYAGHGIEVDRVNYLIPVDARLRSDLAVEDETVSLDRVLKLMEPARKLRVVILDACRENPFLKSMKRTVAARSVGRGLGRIEPSTTNTLIAYATKPNAIAEDGKGPNSPFTSALVKHLLTPGLDLRIALGKVRDEVVVSTGGRQEPYVTTSLGGEVVAIIPGILGAEPPTPAAKSRFAPQTFEHYLTVYPFPRPSTAIAAKIRSSSQLRTLLSSELTAQKAQLSSIEDIVKAFLHEHLKLRSVKAFTFLHEQNVDNKAALEHEVMEVGRQYVLGKSIRVFASTSKPVANWECRACRVELSLFEFVDDFGTLSTASVALGVGSYGQWGGLAKEKIRTVGIGPNRYGVLVEGGGAFPGGSIEITESLVIPVAGTYLAVFEEITSSGGPSVEDAIYAEMRFLPTDGYFFDITLEKVTTTKAGRERRETLFFEFDGVRGAYRKTPPRR